MKKLSILVVIALFSCRHNDPTPDPQTIFTIDADPGFFSADSVWLLAWNNDGEIIDYQKYTPGVKTDLQAKLAAAGSDRFNLATLQYGYTTDNRESYTIEVYTDILQGSTLKYTNRKLSWPGRFKVNLPDRPHESYISVSSGVLGSFSNETDSSFLMVRVDPNASKYNLVYHDDLLGSLHKMVTDELKVGDEISFTIDELKPYETPVTFNMPQSNYYWGTLQFNGYETGQEPYDAGYILDNYNIPQNSGSVSSGYFPSISKFRTTISVYEGRRNLTYYKYGSLPGTISWPDPDIYSVVESTPTKFSVSTTGPLQWVTGYWTKENSKTVYEMYVFTGRREFTIGKIPGSIIQRFPGFVVSNSTYELYRMMFSTAGPPYDQVISSFLNDELPEQELMDIYVWPTLEQESPPSRLPARDNARFSRF